MGYGLRRWLSVTCPHAVTGLPGGPRARTTDRGRVKSVSEPYTATGYRTSAPRTAYTYDVRDRVTAVSQPDSGRTAIVYAAQSGNRVKVTTGDTGTSAYMYGNGMSGQPALTELAGVSIGGVSHSLTHDAWGRVTQYDRTGTATEDRHIGWNARHLPTAVTVGDSLADSTPKAKDEFLYGPDGQRYYKKSTWEVPGADPMSPPTRLGFRLIPRFRRPCGQNRHPVVLAPLPIRAVQPRFVAVPLERWTPLQRQST